MPRSGQRSGPHSGTPEFQISIERYDVTGKVVDRRKVSARGDLALSYEQVYADLWPATPNIPRSAQVLVRVCDAESSQPGEAGSSIADRKAHWNVHLLPIIRYYPFKVRVAHEDAGEYTPRDPDKRTEARLRIAANRRLGESVETLLDSGHKGPSPRHYVVIESLEGGYLDAYDRFMRSEGVTGIDLTCIPLSSAEDLYAMLTFVRRASSAVHTSRSAVVMSVLDAIRWPAIEKIAPLFVELKKMLPPPPAGTGTRSGGDPRLSAEELSALPRVLEFFPAGPIPKHHVTALTFDLGPLPHTDRPARTEELMAQVDETNRCVYRWLATCGSCLTVFELSALYAPKGWLTSGTFSCLFSCVSHFIHFGFVLRSKDDYPQIKNLLQYAVNCCSLHISSPFYCDGPDPTPRPELTGHDEALKSLLDALKTKFTPAEQAASSSSQSSARQHLALRPRFTLSLGNFVVDPCNDGCTSIIKCGSDIARKCNYQLYLRFPGCTVTRPQANNPVTKLINVVKSQAQNCHVLDLASLCLEKGPSGLATLGAVGCEFAVAEDMSQAREASDGSISMLVFETDQLMPDGAAAGLGWVKCKSGDSLEVDGHSWVATQFKVHVEKTECYVSCHVGLILSKSTPPAGVSEEAREQYVALQRTEHDARPALVSSWDGEIRTQVGTLHSHTTRSQVMFNLSEMKLRMPGGGQPLQGSAPSTFSGVPESFLQGGDYIVYMVVNKKCIQVRVAKVPAGPGGPWQWETVRFGTREWVELTHEFVHRGDRKFTPALSLHYAHKTDRPRVTDTTFCAKARLVSVRNLTDLGSALQPIPVVRLPLILEHEIPPASVQAVFGAAGPA